MIINVHVIASIHSDRSFRPIEVLSLLQSAHTGTEVSTDVPSAMLVSDFISALSVQLGLNNLQLHEPFYVLKDDIVLETTKTLEESGVIANDKVHLRVTLYLA
jgi:hypothetical protein